MFVIIYLYVYMFTYLWFTFYPSRNVVYRHPVKRCLFILLRLRGIGWVRENL